MEKLVQNIPSLRLTIAFAMGIFITAHYAMPVYLLVACSFLLATFLILIHRFYGYSLELLFGISAFILFGLLGSVYYQHFNQPPDFNYGKSTFSAVILEKPEEKPKSWKSQLLIKCVYRNDSAFRSEEKIVVYFEKSDKARQLNPGDVILFDRNPQTISNSGNPFEFDYKKYLYHKRIYRQVYLDESHWYNTGEREKSLLIWAEATRDKLLTIYREQNLGENETEILSALTLGYKRGLDPETKRVFSSAGAMHVLAVSGLHVGIIFGMFSLLFGFLKREKNGKYLFVIFSLLLLWGYAIITGLSPSVLRASLMFTLVSVSQNLNRNSGIYNTLAVSAFILLVLNPNNLFDVGFQLSYSAVFGIVFLQPKLEKLWPAKHKIVISLRTLLTVSVAAQIATFPLTSYYFHQFPVYFWLTNLVVIPAAFLLIILGISLLIFSQVPGLSVVLAFLTKWSVKLIFQLLNEIERLPHSVQEINLLQPEFLALMLAFLFLFAYIGLLNIKHLKLAAFALTAVFISGIVQHLLQRNNHEIIVHNDQDHLLIGFVSGQNYYVISDRPLQPDDYGYRSVEAIRQNKRLNKPIRLLLSDNYEDNLLIVRNGIVGFGGKLILTDSGYMKSTSKVIPDYLITKRYYENEKNPKVGPANKIIVTDWSFRGIQNNSIYSVKDRGAFWDKWK